MRGPSERHGAAFQGGPIDAASRQAIDLSQILSIIGILSLPVRPACRRFAVHIEGLAGDILRGIGGQEEQQIL